MEGYVHRGIPSKAKDAPPTRTAIITTAGILYLHLYFCSLFIACKNRDYFADNNILYDY